MSIPNSEKFHKKLQNFKFHEIFKHYTQDHKKRP